MRDYDDIARNIAGIARNTARNVTRFTGIILGIFENSARSIARNITRID